MIRIFLLSLVILASTATLALGQPVKRDVLAMYNGSEDRQIETTRIHQALETPFNHLGYRLDYRALADGLPGHGTLTGYYAVVSWIEADTTLGMDYFAAANAAMDAGVKWIVFGDIGAPSAARDHPVYRGFLERLGLRDTGEYVSVTYDARIAHLDSGIYGFEAQLSEPLAPFPALVAASPAAEIFLSVSTPQVEQPALLAAASPNGGFVASSYGMVYIEDLERTAWLLDPFAFLERALDPPLGPIPDTTTLSGRRLYFSHIDGDGWINGAAAEGYQGRGYVAAEVIMEEAIKAYPDLPVSVGLVAGDIVYDETYAERAASIARELFALPQVEVASHTMTHPFLWHHLSDYDRKAELADLAQRTPPESTRWQGLFEALGVATPEPFTPPPGDPWRFYADAPYSIDEEVHDALAVSQELAPPGKEAGLYLWSGNTSPDAATIAATRAAGVANMNGGDTRLDSIFPSLTYVAPLSRPVDGERQIYAVNSNENTYTNLWRGPFYGQMLLEETWERTGAPRRLRPQNLYYHMYAGERTESLAALIHHLELARHGEVIPVAASRYARIADGFFSASIVAAGEDAWRIVDRGALQTVRFDPAPSRLPDYARSEGVIGHFETHGALYVTLDSAVEAPLLVLADGLGPVPLALAQSRWQVWNVSRSGCGLSAQTSGFGRPEMEWWAEPGQYDVTTRDGDRVLSEASLTTENGLLRFNPDLTGYASFSLEIACGVREAGA